MTWEDSVNSENNDAGHSAEEQGKQHFFIIIAAIKNT